MPTASDVHLFGTATREEQDQGFVGSYYPLFGCAVRGGRMVYKAEYSVRLHILLMQCRGQWFLGSPFALYC